MERLRVYKGLKINYQEFENALLALGYDKKIANGFAWFTLKKYDSIVRFSTNFKPSDIVSTAHFLSSSEIMELKGVIEHRDDFAKWIEKNRSVAIAA